MQFKGFHLLKPTCHYNHIFSNYCVHTLNTNSLELLYDMYISPKCCYEESSTTLLEISLKPF